MASGWFAPPFPRAAVVRCFFWLSDTKEAARVKTRGAGHHYITLARTRCHGFDLFPTSDFDTGHGCHVVL